VAIAETAKAQSTVDHRFEKLLGMDVRNAILSGFNSAFTTENISSGFRNTGLRPCNLQALVGTGIRRSFHDEALASVEECVLSKNQLILDFKRFGMFDPVIRRGFMDTTADLELTRDDVIELIGALEADRKWKSQEKEKFEDFK